jgi:threonine/homoserine/homoserine lactone efflux protein
MAVVRQGTDHPDMDGFLALIGIFVGFSGLVAAALVGIAAVTGGEARDDNSR